LAAGRCSRPYLEIAQVLRTWSRCSCLLRRWPASSSKAKSAFPAWKRTFAIIARFCVFARVLYFSQKVQNRPASLKAYRLTGKPAKPAAALVPAVDEQCE
jgi:hypothetical protein